MKKDSLSKQIRSNMELKETDELLQIWKSNDLTEWSPQALEIVKEILTSRLGELPEQQPPVTEKLQADETLPYEFFFSIWVKPRQTIRQIIEKNPTKYVILLAALSGIGQALDRASSRNMGDSSDLGLIIPMSLIFGPIGGIVSLYIGGALYRWSGSWLGGKGTEEEVRAAIAWASVPTSLILLLWIPELLIFGSDLFKSSMPLIETNPMLGIALFGFSSIEFVVGIWTFIILLNTIGEVHKFSAWKALGSIFLGTLVILLPVLLIAGILFVL